MSGTPGCHRTQSEKYTSGCPTDVSILVTEASPEGVNVRPQDTEATVVQVLVHRESEEYNEDAETNADEPLEAVANTSNSPLRGDNLDIVSPTDVVIDIDDTNTAS